MLTIIKENEVNKTNLIRDFLLEMLLTNQWSDKFENLLIEDEDDRWSNHISAYTHKIGLIKYDKNSDYQYAISNRGRKYLEKQNTSM